MSENYSRRAIGEKIHFNSVTDEKFKHNRLSFNFIVPLTKETASENAVIPFILRKGCKKHPDFTALNKRLEELYGASLGADVTKYGHYQILEISIRSLDGRYALNGEEITRESAELLASVALEPNFGPDGCFLEADVASERQYVIDTIESLINEKRGYALSQCKQFMCGDEPHAVRKYGYTEYAEKITPASATAAYRNMLKTAAVEIFFTGSGNPEGVRELFEERLKGLERSSFGYTRPSARKTATEVKEHTETMELSQSKLVMGMRTGEVNTPKQVRAARVFAAMYGGTPISKLFLNVREKLSLCYYCSVRFDQSTRILTVDSGIEAKNKQKAIDEILKQLESIKSGDITEKELHETKLLIKNSILATTDSQSSTESWYLTQALRGTSDSPKEDIEAISEITAKDVIEAAGKITLDTVYFLTGEDSGEAK